MKKTKPKTAQVLCFTLKDVDEEPERDEAIILLYRGSGSPFLFYSKRELLDYLFSRNKRKKRDLIREYKKLGWKWAYLPEMPERTVKNDS